MHVSVLTKHLITSNVITNACSMENGLLLPNDSDLQNIYMVVGYKDTCASTYKELKIYGIYFDKNRAKQRIQHITLKWPSCNIVNGNNYCCWINKMSCGDTERVPNAGAYELL